jgi:ribosomal protein S18 acetylase RimI-like enzyme
MERGEPYDRENVGLTELEFTRNLRSLAMKIVIRPYRPSDRDAVIALTVAAFDGVSIDHNLDRRLGPVAGRDWRWRKGRDVERDIDTPGSELAVAEYEETGEVAGYVTLFMDQESRIGWIHNLAVEAGLRGQGLGRRLIEHALDHFRKGGMTVARIETLEQNSVGRHLYPSVGFQEVARQIHFAMPLEGLPTGALETDSDSGTT